QKVIHEILFDHVALVTKADDEILDAMVTVDFHDVPDDRPAADLDHRLGPQRAFFRDAAAEPAGEDDAFQGRISPALTIMRLLPCRPRRPRSGATRRS